MYRQGLFWARWRGTRSPGCGAKVSQHEAAAAEGGVELRQPLRAHLVRGDVLHRHCALVLRARKAKDVGLAAEHAGERGERALRVAVLLERRGGVARKREGGWR